MYFDSRRRAAMRSLVALAAAGAAFPRLARAARYPDRAIRFVVPFNVGGNVDGVGRLMAAAMGPKLGQSIVVDNKVGAGGSVGAASVALGPADGYTVLVGSNGPLTINPFVQPKLPYDPMKDFAPITLVGTVPHVLIVNPDLHATTVKEVAALSRKQAVNCGSAGVGSATQLTLERFNLAAGARLVHVPYRGGNSLVPDLLGGAIQGAFMEFSTALPLHQSGKARIVAVASATRSSLAPDIPTFIEGGVAGFTAYSFVGLLVPARTPEANQALLVAAAESVLATPAMSEHLTTLGLQPADQAARAPAAFAAFLRQDYERSREIVRLAGIHME